MTNPRNVTWIVDGMTCGGCSGSVERVVGGAAGIEAVSASHETREVKLTVSGPLDGDDIARRIENAGFDVVTRG